MTSLLSALPPLLVVIAVATSIHYLTAVARSPERELAARLVAAAARGRARLLLDDGHDGGRLRLVPVERPRELPPLRRARGARRGDLVRRHLHAAAGAARTCTCGARGRDRARVTSALPRRDRRGDPRRGGALSALRGRRLRRRLRAARHRRAAPALRGRLRLRRAVLRGALAARDRGELPQADDDRGGGDAAAGRARLRRRVARAARAHRVALRGGADDRRHLELPRPARRRASRRSRAPAGELRRAGRRRAAQRRAGGVQRERALVLEGGGRRRRERAGARLGRSRLARRRGAGALRRARARRRSRRSSAAPRPARASTSRAGWCSPIAS